MERERNRAGRPRNEVAIAAVRKAAMRLVRSQGYRNVTIAAIAQEAGVARQTLYNRWTAKADLVLDAIFAETARSVDLPPVPESCTCSERLEAFLTSVFAHLASDGGTLRSLIAAAQEDGEFCAAFRERFVLPRELLVTRLLIEAKLVGELPHDADPETLSAMIHGAFWYRLLNGLQIDATFSHAITAMVFARGPSKSEPLNHP